MVVEGDFRAEGLIGHNDYCPEQKEREEPQAEPGGFKGRGTRRGLNKHQEGKGERSEPAAIKGFLLPKRLRVLSDMQPDGRIGEGVKSAEPQNDRTDEGNMDPDHVGVEFRKEHVHRDADNGQRESGGRIQA